MIQQCNLIDIDMTCSNYIWTRKDRGSVKMANSLVIMFRDCLWHTTFPEACLENLSHHHSDHHPIILRGIYFVPAKQVRSFRFQVT